MYKKSQKIDTVMLAVALFTVSGAILAYNLQTVSGGEFSVSLSELAAYAEPAIVGPPPSAVSACAAAHLDDGDSVYVSAVPSEPVRTWELLEPIVKPPVA